jgi:hypothetical protein
MAVVARGTAAGCGFPPLSFGSGDDAPQNTTASPAVLPYLFFDADSIEVRERVASASVARRAATTLLGHRLTHDAASSSDLLALMHCETHANTAGSFALTRPSQAEHV